jgi:serine/threonine-protein kinase HipA
MGNKCLCCYQDIDDGDFHQNCSKKIFGAFPAPDLPYTRDTMQDLAKEIIQHSVSVPGVQAKLSLHLFSGERGHPPRFTLVGLWGNYILKPPVTAYPGMVEIEDCTMHLAELFHLSVVPHSLIRLAPQGRGELAYITRRIDRIIDHKNDRTIDRSNTAAPRIHMEDFCQLSGKLTEDKYRGSLESCVRLIRHHSSNTLLDILAFFELAVFSFLTGNGDMHLKNFSLIYNENGMVSLTPAYDLLATRLLISEKHDPEEFALTMNGKKRNFTLNDFIKFGTGSGLSPKQMENCFTKFGRSLDKAALLIEDSFIAEPLKAEYRALIEARGRRLGLR